MMIHARVTPALTDTIAMAGMRGIAAHCVCGMESRIAKTVIRGTYNGGKTVGVGLGLQTALSITARTFLSLTFPTRTPF